MEPGKEPDGARNDRFLRMIKKASKTSHRVPRSRQHWNWVFHARRFGENLTDRLRSVMAIL